MSFVSFYFGSLDFKPHLNEKKKMCVKIELSNGKVKSTEGSTYNTKENIIVFSESFDFDFANPVDIPYFHLLICEYLPDDKIEIFAKKTIHLYKDMPDRQETKLESKTGISVHLYYGIDFSDNIREKLPDSSTKESQAPELKEIISETNLMELDILSLGPLFKNFVESVGPLVDMKKIFIDFISWKNPTETIFISLAMTLFYVYHRITLFFSLLIFFRYSQIILSHIMKQKIKNPEKNILVYKRNLIFIKNFMEFAVSSYKYYKQVIDHHDKSTLFNLLSIIKRFSLVIAILLLVFDTNQLIILIYWTFLLQRTKQGKHTLDLVQDKVIEFIDLFNDLVQENAHLSKIIPLSKRNSIVPNSTKNIKTFYICENQRWWLGRGWCNQMLLGERPQWSDDLGKVPLNKDDFHLPGPNWVWESDWTVEQNSENTEDGWEYAADFRSPFKTKATPFSYVRRRKWFRRCYQTM